MNANEAQSLLDRYFAGETTLAEERQLAAYFRGPTVAAQLAPYAPLFAYWARQAERSYPHRSPRPYRTWLTAAAIALVLLAVHFLLPRPEHRELSHFPVETRRPVDWSRYEVTDREEALRLVGGALARVGEGMARSRQLTVDELRRTHDILNQ